MIVSMVLVNHGYDQVAQILNLVGSGFEALAFVFIIIRVVNFGFQLRRASKAPRPVKFKEPKTVNVKPVKETQEEKLYKQYVDLCAEGLISKEDLEKKRKELLGK